MPAAARGTRPDRDLRHRRLVAQALSQQPGARWVGGGQGRLGPAPQRVATPHNGGLALGLSGDAPNYAAGLRRVPREGGHDLAPHGLAALLHAPGRRGQHGPAGAEPAGSLPPRRASGRRRARGDGHGVPPLDHAPGVSADPLGTPQSKPRILLARGGLGGLGGLCGCRQPLGLGRERQQSPQRSILALRAPRVPGILRLPAPPHHDCHGPTPQDRDRHTAERLHGLCGRRAAPAAVARGGLPAQGLGRAAARGDPGACRRRQAAADAAAHLARAGRRLRRRWDRAAPLRTG
mmetsp:Transcript_103237/g.274534  ORF Transcript_103237/g.274534 Transcript_103237/m.274534 type:complete len:292 (-) Transcript_103237:340-1215(-)